VLSSSQNPCCPFDFAVDRTTTGYLDVVLPDDRRMLIAPGTLGEISCEELDQPARCVVLADTLGDILP